MSIVYNVLSKLVKKYLMPDYLEGLKKRGLVVGNNLKLLPEARIDWSHCWHVRIGNDVTIAPRVHILAHDASTKTHLGYTRIGKVKIGDRVFIGASSVILPGVTIGNDVIIGAGSIVTKDIPDGVVAAGNPCRVLCGLEEFLNRRKSEMHAVPVFDETYTIAKNVNDEKKAEMNRKMKDDIGYVY